MTRAVYEIGMTARAAGDGESGQSVVNLPRDVVVRRKDHRVLFEVAVEADSPEEAVAAARARAIAFCAAINTIAASGPLTFDDEVSWWIPEIDQKVVADANVPAVGRAEILGAMVRALEEPDLLVARLLAAPDIETALVELRARLAIGPVEARAVVDLQLLRLVADARQRLRDEFDQYPTPP